MTEVSKTEVPETSEESDAPSVEEFEAVIKDRTADADFDDDEDDDYYDDYDEDEDDE